MQLWNCISHKGLSLHTICSVAVFSVAAFTVAGTPGENLHHGTNLETENTDTVNLTDVYDPQHTQGSLGTLVGSLQPIDGKLYHPEDGTANGTLDSEDETFTELQQTLQALIDLEDDGIKTEDLRPPHVKLRGLKAMLLASLLILFVYHFCFTKNKGGLGIPMILISFFISGLSEFIYSLYVRREIQQTFENAKFVIANTKDPHRRSVIKRNLTKPLPPLDPVASKVFLWLTVVCIAIAFTSPHSLFVSHAINVSTIFTLLLDSAAFTWIFMVLRLYGHMIRKFLWNVGRSFKKLKHFSSSKEHAGANTILARRVRHQ